MNGPRQTRIKLYGERNTGTRYLTRLLELNLEAKILEGVAPRWAALLNSVAPGRWNGLDWYFSRSFARNLGWKHSQARLDRLLELGDATEAVHFVTLVKNPYSWLLSMARRPYHRKPGAGETDIRSLLSQQWLSTGRDNGPAAYRNALDLWNCKVRSYIELAEQFPVTFLTYEALVQDPEQSVNRVRQDGRLEQSGGKFVNPEESTKDSDKDSSFYRRYYGEELWRDRLSQDDIRRVNQHLDHELMEQFGYRMIESA